MTIQSILDQFISNPRKLFLIDGLGALLSAFLLGFVLVSLEPIFGIPASALYILAIIPIFFALYDGYCYFSLKANLSTFLKGIAILNLSYCVLSLGFAFYHSESLTVLGWTYIILEILIVVTLAIIELKTASHVST